jgi:hypothetical protein
MKTPAPIEIFKPGKHTAMSGAVLDFSESDLQAMVDAYDPAIHEAPLVVGHPKSDKPRYGGVDSLSYAAGIVAAGAKDVLPEFAEWVNKKLFNKVSASFYTPDSPNNPVPGVYYLRHVGFLGAQPPAIKGLNQNGISFGEEEEGVVEFGDWEDRTNAGLWRGMRDWLIAKFGLEEADKALPAWNVQTLADIAAQPETSETSAFADPPTHEENHVTPEQKAALEAENAQLKAQLATAEAAQTAAAQAKRHGDNVSFAEQLVSDGKLAPKHKDAIVAFLDFSEADAALEFGEGDAKQPLAGAFKAFLGDMPKVVEFAEQATHGRATTAATDDDAQFAESADPERIKQHQAIKAHMAEHKVDYATAARAVLK